MSIVSCLTCLPHFFGFSDRDECRETVELCGNFSNCINLNGSFECVCKEGFSGVGANCTGKQLSYAPVARGQIKRAV